MEEAGLLSFAADNLDVLINLFGFLAVEPAKLAIPAVSQPLTLYIPVLHYHQVQLLSVLVPSTGNTSKHLYYSVKYG